MDFNTELNEALKAFREVRLDKKSDDELVSMIRIFRQWQVAQFAGEAPQAIEAVEKEIARRQRDRHQEGAKTLHQLQMEQGKNLHQETVGEMGKLKSSVDRLKTSVDRLSRPRGIEWWILAAGWIAAIAAVIAAWIELFPKH